MLTRNLWLVPSVAVLFSIASCGTPPETYSAVAGAARVYVVNNSAVKKVGTAGETIAGDYARVTVSPTDRTVTDPVWVFLKKEKGEWKGLTMGTAFSRKDYRKLGIPRRLWLE